MGLRQDMARFGIRAKKSLGQNFLVDDSVVRAIAEGAPVAGERVAEIGPGFGALTAALAARKPASLDLAEFDPDMVGILRRRAADGELPGVSVHQADALRWDFPHAGPWRLFGNIPYYITSPLFRRFLYDVANPPLSCVFLVQKEVADKVLCLDGKHSVLSLLVHWRADRVSRVASAPARCFDPAPKVDSAAVRVDLASPKPAPELTDEFLRLVHAGFAEKRKQLAGNLARALGGTKPAWEARFSALGLRPDIRAEDVPLAAWRSLAEARLAGK